jgi:hypothetical protein
MKNSIIKRQSEPQSNFNAFVWALFLLYASRPSKRNPEPDGSYFIGDVGEAAEPTFKRWSPYSIAEPSR